MSTRKLVSWLLILTLAPFVAPVSAQEFTPNTVWGEVPAGAGAAMTAILHDMGGNVVGTAQVIGSRFSFPDVVPGQYTAELKDAAGASLRTSLIAVLQGGAIVKVAWGDDQPAAILPQTTGAGGGGHTTTWLIIGGAVAAGVATALVVKKIKDDDKDKPPQSPSR